MAWTLTETDSLSNQNISSVLAIGAHTVAADGKIGILVLANQVAGNGDYTIYATITRSGTEHRLIPISTGAAASGVTGIAFSGETWARAADVITVYLDGLAGDTTTPDTTVDWFVTAAATAAALATVDGKLPAALVSGRIDASVGAMAAGVVTAAAVATGAIDADALAADASAEIADAVWDEAIAGHAGAGSTGAALSAAGSAGDPWVTDITTYTGTQAGSLFTDLWAVMVGDMTANNATNPTSITYDEPDGTVQVTHTLTSTTRTVS